MNTINPIRKPPRFRLQRIVLAFFLITMVGPILILAGIPSVSLVFAGIPGVVTLPAADNNTGWELGYAVMLSGNITATGDGANTTNVRGFVYDAEQHSCPEANQPINATDYWLFVKETGNFNIGAYNMTVTNLNPETIYYFRATAHNEADGPSDNWSYGNELCFKTMAEETLAADDTLTVLLPDVFDKYLALALATLISLLAFWQNHIFFYILAVPVNIVYGLSLATDAEINSAFWVTGIIIAIIGTACLFKAVLMGWEEIRVRRRG